MRRPLRLLAAAAAALTLAGCDVATGADGLVLQPTTHTFTFRAPGMAAGVPLALPSAETLVVDGALLGGFAVTDVQAVHVQSVVVDRFGLAGVGLTLADFGPMAFRLNGTPVSVTAPAFGASAALEAAPVDLAPAYRSGALRGELRLVPTRTFEEEFAVRVTYTARITVSDL